MRRFWAVICVCAALAAPGLAAATTPPPTLHETWRYPLQQPDFWVFDPSPAIGELALGSPGLETVFGTAERLFDGLTGSFSGRYVALGANGQLVWEGRTPDDWSQASPLVADLGGTWVDGQGNPQYVPPDGRNELVGASTSGRYVLAYEGESGALRWQFGPFAEFKASPAVAEVNLASPGPEIVAANQDRMGTGAYVFCLSSQGAELWRFPQVVVGAGEHFTATPAVADVDGDYLPEVVAVNDAGRVFVLDALSGQLELSFAVPGPSGGFALRGTLQPPYFAAVVSSPLVGDVDGDGRVEIVVGTAEGRLHCFDSAGYPKWVYPSPNAQPLGPIASSPAAADIDLDGTVEIVFGAPNFVGPTGGAVHCVDGRGFPEWTYPIIAPVNGSPSLADRHQPGSVQWPAFRGGAARTGFYPRPGHGPLSIYIGADDGSLSLLSHDGRLVDQFLASAPVNCSPAVGDVDGDGLQEVLFKDTATTIYALRDSGFELPPSRWQTRSPVPEAVANAASGTFGGGVYVLGGESAQFGPSGSVYRYDPWANQWFVAPPLPWPLFAAGDTTDGENIYLAGGSSAGLAARSEVLAYRAPSGTFGTVGWLQAPRMNADAAVLHGRLYVAGGADQGAVLDTMEEFDLANVGVPPRTLAMPDGREMAAVLAADTPVGRRIFVIGGWDRTGAPTSTCWEFNPGFGTFTARPPLPIPVAARTAVVLNGRIYVVGGITSPRANPFTWTTAIQEFDPWTGMWTVLPPDFDVPSSRYAATAEVGPQGGLHVIGGDTATYSGIPVPVRTHEYLDAGFFPPPHPPLPGDTIAPSSRADATCAVPGDGWWCRSQVTVAIVAQDDPAGSGVSRIEYSFDGTTWSSVAGAVASIVVTAQGATDLQFRAVDFAGNVESPPNLIPVLVDATPPVVAVSLSGTGGTDGWYRSAVTATLAAADNESGVWEMQYSLDGGPWLPSTGTLEIAAEGLHLLSVRAVNGAGLVGVPAVDPVEVKIDVTAPAVAGVDPPPGSRDVPLDAVVAVFFSEPVAAGPKFAEAALKAVTRKGSSVIPAAMSFDAEGRILYFTPAGPLDRGATVSISVPEGSLADRAGLVNAGFESSFTAVKSGRK